MGLTCVGFKQVTNWAMAQKSQLRATEWILFFFLFFVLGLGYNFTNDASSRVWLVVKQSTCGFKIFFSSSLTQLVSWFRKRQRVNRSR